VSEREATPSDTSDDDFPFLTEFPTTPEIFFPDSPGRLAKYQWFMFASRILLRNTNHFLQVPYTSQFAKNLNMQFLDCVGQAHHRFPKEAVQGLQVALPGLKVEALVFRASAGSPSRRFNKIRISSFGRMITGLCNFKGLAISLYNA
jgi:hypothetical protein